jgi:excisionase family DNA binding protein
MALRPREAAQVLGVSERFVRQILPELPRVRLGGAVVIPTDMLREWLREQAGKEKSRVEGVVNEVLKSFEGNG